VRYLRRRGRRHARRLSQKHEQGARPHPQARAIPILNTIPPFKAQLKRTKQFNEALRTIAKERGIPVLDLEREIFMRRPDDWFGTLMDRIHLTASQTGGNPAAEPTPENLKKSGYQFRGWLTVQKIAEIKRTVLD
jgi:hypothetical protein